MEKIIVTFCAAYMEEPLIFNEKGQYQHYSITQLKVSENLQRRIIEWDEQYQKTLDSEYPPDSKFGSIQEAIEHNKLGTILSRELQNELGDQYIVDFIPHSLD